MIQFVLADIQLNCADQIINYLKPLGFTKIRIPVDSVDTLTFNGFPNIDVLFMELRCVLQLKNLNILKQTFRHIVAIGTEHHIPLEATKLDFEIIARDEFNQINFEIALGKLLLEKFFRENDRPKEIAGSFFIKCIRLQNL